MDDVAGVLNAIDDDEEGALEAEMPPEFAYESDEEPEELA